MHNFVNTYHHQKPTINNPPFAPFFAHPILNKIVTTRILDIQKMSSGSWSHEITTAVSTDRLFKAAVIDWHNLGPKIAPEIITSAAVLSGDGAPGSVRELKFTSALPFSFIKERLDFVDHNKFETKSTIIEGGDLGKTLESASTHFKFEPTEGGCVVKVVASYKLLPGVAADDGQIVKGKEAVTGHIKAAEAYLLANPTAYA